MGKGLSSSGSMLRTLTTRNAPEFGCYPKIARILKPTVYDADSYASMQKGAIENLNKLIRQYLPKGLIAGKYRMRSLGSTVQNQPQLQGKALLFLPLRRSSSSSFCKIALVGWRSYYFFEFKIWWKEKKLYLCNPVCDGTSVWRERNEEQGGEKEFVLSSRELKSSLIFCKRSDSGNAICSDCESTCWMCSSCEKSSCIWKETQNRKKERAFAPGLPGGDPRGSWARRAGQEDRYHEEFDPGSG